jgi:1-acyl-sn-glycerol-3-phosphate acyltransferase
MTVGMWLRWRYRIVTENQELVNRLKPPYLVLANHACVLDPFMLNSMVPYAIHYVVSDASFRSRLVSFGLSLVGSIPKTKVMSDLDTIKRIVRVRDRGGIIGIFPEGQSTWDGHSLPMYYSTAKLAKLLRIPVVTAGISGAYFSRPRWAKSDRRGRVFIRFTLALTRQQLREATPEEIDRRIASLLEKDAFEFNRKAGVKYVGRDRAEYLERALFMCPSCREIGSLHSHENTFGCRTCGYTVRYNPYGFLVPVDGGPPFTTVREWNLWQVDEFARRLREYLASPTERPLLREELVHAQIGYKSLPLSPFASGALELYPDRIVLVPESGSVETFRIDEIDGANVQNNEHWEFYAGADLFRISCDDPRGNTYKWDMALRMIKEHAAGRAPEAAT